MYADQVNNSTPKNSTSAHYASPMGLILLQTHISTTILTIYHLATIVALSLRVTAYTNHLGLKTMSIFPIQYLCANHLPPIHASHPTPRSFLSHLCLTLPYTPMLEPTISPTLYQLFPFSYIAHVAHADIAQPSR